MELNMAKDVKDNKGFFKYINNKKKIKDNKGPSTKWKDDPEDKKVRRSSQDGFTERKTCLTNLIALYDETTTWMDEEREVDIVCLDFTKAFDSCLL
ncbi:hypothetical protein BTVI_143419 [Pitangus sulphuratus]|nr:hypothetical protein BTVI_143419 [Pitangus sulphuratus]